VHLSAAKDTPAERRLLTFCTRGDDLLRKLRPGIDGVILATTYGTSTFLPQVWEELSDPEVFLGELCRKHGAPSSAWRTQALLRVEVYQANHFSESDPGLGD